MGLRNTRRQKTRAPRCIARLAHFQRCAYRWLERQLALIAFWMRNVDPEKVSNIGPLKKFLQPKNLEH